MISQTTHRPTYVQMFEVSIFCFGKKSLMFAKAHIIEMSVSHDSLAIILIYLFAQETFKYYFETLKTVALLNIFYENHETFSLLNRMF